MKPHVTNFPTLTRRDVLRVGLVTVAAYDLAPVVRPVNVHAKEKIQPRGAAEYCIWLFLKGGAPQLDTWDLKEGSWTRPDFDVRMVNGIRWPYGLFPGMAARLNQITLARSLETWESAHPRAQYYMQTGHIISPARIKETPSIGAVVAYEFQSRRKGSDFLPPFVAINYGANGLVREGCLPGSCTPLSLMTERPTPFVLPDEEKAVFERRWTMLREMEKAVGEADPYTESAYGMMSTPGLPKVMTLSPENRNRYGSSAFGDGCLLARQLVEAEAGTRHILVAQDGWDLHANMYNPKGRNHYTLCRELDVALCALLSDLEATKDSSGRALLEKTFVVCMGEFGRTGGGLTVNAGRDHNRFAMTGLFAGAGVRGQVFGETDDHGRKVTKTDWERKRSIYPEDVMATVYSQLGIDWSKQITNTPSGRAFEYIEGQSGTEFMDFGEISRLFA